MFFVIIGLVKGGEGGSAPFPPLGETLHYIHVHVLQLRRKPCIYMNYRCIHTSVETIGKEHAQCAIDDSATVTVAVLSEWATMWFTK